MQSEINEIVIVKPPPYCPYSDPTSYWLLKKSLYGLRRAPRYWYDRISSVLRTLNLVECPNEPCYFVGHLIDGLPELHLVIYVDDFIYFSISDEVEKHFEQALEEHVIVDFMGTVDYFLGIRFSWKTSNKSNFSCKLVQEGYIETLAHKMGIPNASVSPKMTPYRSGFPIDAIPPDNSLSDSEQIQLTSNYRSLVGMLSWISTSTRTGTSTVVSFLQSYQSKPTKAHVDSAIHVGKYLLSTIEKGINFSYRNGSERLCGYTHVPFDDFKPIGFVDANWGPQDASKPSAHNNRLVSLLEIKSVCGFIIFMGGAPLMWKSFKELRNSRSSCEAEIKASDE